MNLAGTDTAHNITDPDAAQLTECMRAFAHNTSALLLSGIDYSRLSALSDAQRLFSVLHLTLNGALPCSEPAKRRLRFEVASQIIRDSAFSRTRDALGKAGVDFLTLKGIISRSLYCNGEYRTSGDEDILIAPADVERCAEILCVSGFEEKERSKSTAVFFEPSVSLRLEVHTSLFESDRRYADRLNSLIDVADTCALDIGGQTIKTLAHTKYLVYTVLHALTHFTAGGFGIRTACDIVMFADRYRGCIDEHELAATLLAAGALGFAEAVFAFGRLYLCIDTGLLYSERDPYPLLCDMLDGGVYGTSDADRNYSVLLSRGTVNGADGSLNMFFPPYSQMRLKYKYLERAPFLLPWTWLERACGYVYRAATGERNIKKSIQTAKARSRLFELYGVGITNTAASSDETDTAGVSADDIYSEQDFDGQLSVRSYVTIGRAGLAELLGLTVQRGVPLTLTVTGGSMVPFLRDRRDCVTLVKFVGTPVRGDIALYERTDGRYVLHRVVRVHGGLIDFAGDAQTKTEKNVRADAVKAVAVSAVRNGAVLKKGCREWDFFAQTWLCLLPLRRVMLSLYRPFGQLRAKRRGKND